MLTEGKLEVYDCDYLQNFSAPALESIDGPNGDLYFRDLPRLRTIHLPLLRKVGGFLALLDTPLLSIVTASIGDHFGGSIMITNTSLSNLDFLLSTTGSWPQQTGRNGSQYTRLIIADNPQLGNITISSSKLYEVDIHNNGPAMGINLPYLHTCLDLHVSSAASLNVPLLESVEKDFSIVNNSMVNLSLPKFDQVWRRVTISNNTLLRYFSSSFSSLGSRDSFGGGLTITGNTALTTIDLTNLAKIQGRTVISNNPLLSSIKLENLSEARSMNISGNFSRHVKPLSIRWTC